MSLNPTTSAWALRAIFFANGGVLSAWVTHLPTIQARVNGSDGDIGVVLSALSAGALIGIPVAGTLCNLLAARWVLVVSCVLVPVAALAPILAHSLPVLVTAGFVYGLLSGSYVTSANIVGVGLESQTGRKVVSSLYAVKGVGGILGSLSTSLALTLRATDILHVGLYALAVLALSVPFLPFVPHVGKSSSGERRSTLAAFLTPAVWLIGGAAMAVLMAESTVQDWGTLLLRKTLQASGPLSASGLTAFSAAVAFTCLVGDFLAKKLGDLNLLVGGGVLAAIGFVLVVVASDPLPAVVGFGLAGLGAGNLPPVALRLAGNIPGVNRAVTITAVTAIAFLGYVVEPLMMGFLSDRVGLQTAFEFPVALCVIVAGGFFVAQSQLARKLRAA